MEGGKVLTVLIALEAVLNTISGAIYVLSPEVMLEPLLAPGTPIPKLASILAQWWGVMVITQAVMLFLVLPNNPSNIRPRRIVYWTLLTGEILLIPVFYIGISQVGSWRWEGAIGFLLALIAFGVWRLVCLVLRPSLFGKVREKST